MDKLKLGGTEVMHHRAAARPETGGEGGKAGRGEEATTAGTGGKWLRRRTGATHLTAG